MEYFLAHKRVTTFSLVGFTDFGCEFVVEINWSEGPTLYPLDSDSSLTFYTSNEKEFEAINGADSSKEHSTQQREVNSWREKFLLPENTSTQDSPRYALVKS